MTPRALITGARGPLGVALCAGFREAGYEIHGYDIEDADLRDEHQCQSLARHVGYADVVVNNAKINDWKHIDILGRIATSSIINISSIYGLVGNDPALYKDTEVEPTPAWYAAQKGAIIALTRWQATNLAPVRSNCVAPGGIFRDHSADFRQRYEAKVPLGRMATESDIVPLVIFLASDTASYITGAVIPADGGGTCML